jgi:hypothetical protein
LGEVVAWTRLWMGHGYHLVGIKPEFDTHSYIDPRVSICPFGDLVSILGRFCARGAVENGPTRRCFTVAIEREVRWFSMSYPGHLADI